MNLRGHNIWDKIRNAHITYSFEIHWLKILKWGFIKSLFPTCKPNLQVDVECIDNYGGDDAENNDGFVSEDLGESMNKNHNDYSHGWLLSGDEQDNVEEEFWKAAEDQQPESTKDVCVMEKDSQSQDQHAPDVKISARTGVGLQELLEIIDERLKTLDD